MVESTCVSEIVALDFGSGGRDSTGFVAGPVDLSSGAALGCAAFGTMAWMSAMGASTAPRCLANSSLRAAKRAARAAAAVLWACSAVVFSAASAAFCFLSSSIIRSKSAESLSVAALVSSAVWRPTAWSTLVTIRRQREAGAGVGGTGRSKTGPGANVDTSATGTGAGRTAAGATAWAAPSDRRSGTRAGASGCTRRLAPVLVL